MLHMYLDKDQHTHSTTDDEANFISTQLV